VAPKSTVVSFELNPESEYACVVLKGAWDNWKGSPMKPKKGGGYRCRKTVPAGKWEYGYLCDDYIWLVDGRAETTPSPFGALNNVLTVGS
jgi:hypothetical protein